MLLIYGFLFMIFFYVFGGILLTGLLSGWGFTLLNPWSFLTIVIPLLFFLLVSGCGKTIGKYFKTSFMKNYTYSTAEYKSISGSAKNTVRFIMAAGGFNFAFYLISALTNLGSLNYLGPYIAMCLTSLTYSISISYFIFFPVQAWAENKINITKNESL